MKKLSIALAIIMALTLTVGVTYLVAYHSVYDSFRDSGISLDPSVDEGNFAKFLSVVKEYNSLYIREEALDMDAINEALIQYYLSLTGDRYNAYYTPEELAELYNSMDGIVAGIGVIVAQDPETYAMVVIALVENGPAEKAGLKVGDAIISVQTEIGQTPISQVGFTNATNYIKGEPGTTVDVTILREENGVGETQLITITREIVQGTKIIYRPHQQDPTVGLIRIMEFDNTTPKDFEKAVRRLQEQGCTRFVVDVRGNPGGLLTSIEAVLDLILPEGPVVRTIDKQGNEEIIYYADKNAPFQTIPWAILVDGDTASAAELFASAIQDYAKIGKLTAQIVGTQTFGKGSMQTISPMNDGSAIKATNYYYCPPFSPNYDGVGVTPDVVVPLSETLFGKNINLISDEEDNQLAAALLTFEH